MSSSDLREKFIEFFVEKGHKIVSSSSLVPENDASVLFTTAGMQQFKRYFSFPDEAPAPKVVSVQKCVRTGDIDDVGDETHLTYFEMLGNFSFGYNADGRGSDITRMDADQVSARDYNCKPYFKKEAIAWAWEFLTKELSIDKSRIYATYFKDEKNEVPEDVESLNVLNSIDGLTEIKPQGFDDNFWSLGTEGAPGGPTVEFYVDGIEIWNLVFNEYILKNGKYEPADIKGVDTGMGLERLATVMQGVHDVYQIDTFRPIITKIEEISGNKYEEYKKEFRIIIDHIKASVYLVADGVEPSNKDRGYVLRRLIRRAIVKARQIGIENDFCVNVSPAVISTDDTCGGAEKSLSVNQDTILTVLESEEEKFGKTLNAGLSEFKRIGTITHEVGADRKQELYYIGGMDLFNLFQNYGLPPEVAIEQSRELGIEVRADAMVKFSIYLLEHQNKSRTASAGMFKGGLADNKIETTRLHTVAHLLLAALREVLGEQVEQKGSNITQERLRFDFNHSEKLTPEQIEKVENIVNEKISDSLPVTMQEMAIDDAKKSGALGSFSDRYGDVVKIYTIGAQEDPYSREICGGPHVKNTSELGCFKIVKEESSSAGVRRIRARLE